MKAMLLRVGIDTNYGGLSPVRYDYSYVYLPIYYKETKGRELKEKRTYKSLGLGEYVNPKIARKKVHLDPEFETFTYGDPGRQKRKALLTLNKGDLLVFYLGGKIKDENEIGCFIFAYFVVKKVYDWDALREGQKKEYEKLLRNNAHLRSSKPKDGLVIVKGSSKSRKLKKCIQITEVNGKSANPPYYTSEEMQSFLGIRNYITYAVPVIITEEEKVRNLRILLGIEKMNPQTFEGKIPFSVFSRIIDSDRRLPEKEKLFIKNFMMSKSNDYRTDAENFGNDVYGSGLRKADLLEEYFIDYHPLLRSVS